MGNAHLFKTSQPIFSIRDIDNTYIKRVILTGLKEKYSGELSKNRILKEKTVNLLIEQTCATNQIAAEIAIKKLGAICNIVYRPMLFCRPTRPIDQIARILGAQGDLVLVASSSALCLRGLIETAPTPTINILNCAQCPALSFAAMMTIFERYKSFENLTVSLIGRPYPYFNSLLLLLPRLGVNTRLLTALSKQARVSPRYFSIAKEFAGRAEKSIQDCKSIEQALDGTDVIMISQNIWQGFELLEKDVSKLCNKNWSLFHDPFEGPSFKSDILDHENTLSFKLIENLRWSYLTILLELFQMKNPDIAEKICLLEHSQKSIDDNPKNWL